MTDEQKAELMKAVAKNINLPGLVEAVLKQVVEPALDKLVADTANPFDNMAKAAMYPTLEAELNKLAKEQWAKLLGVSV